MSNPFATSLQGQTIADYALTEVIGSGAFGVVYAANHVGTKMQYALKVLTSFDVEHILDFENEGRILKALDSCDGVIDYVGGGSASVDFTSQNGMVVPFPVHYHVLVLAEGSLEELILDPESRSQLTWQEKLYFWRNAVSGVSQMHNNSVAHRDLKTSNCLLVVRSTKTSVKLTDLGRAKDLKVPSSRPLEQYHIGRGDLRFAPPEYLMWQGGSSPADFRAADYYGLGSLLVEMLTGQSMTALAIGSFQQALIQAKRDAEDGVKRDLSALVPRYRHVTQDIVDTLPKAIRSDAAVLIESLCHPVPVARAKAPFRKDRLSGSSLGWVLRRIDIMVRRLRIEEKLMLQKTGVKA